MIFKARLSATWASSLLLLASVDAGAQLLAPAEAPTPAKRETIEVRCPDSDRATNPLARYEGTYKVTLDNDLFAFSVGQCDFPHSSSQELDECRRVDGQIVLCRFHKISST